MSEPNDPRQEPSAPEAESASAPAADHPAPAPSEGAPPAPPADEAPPAPPIPAADDAPPAPADAAPPAPTVGDAPPAPTTHFAPPAPAPAAPQRSSQAEAQPQQWGPQPPVAQQTAAPAAHTPEGSAAAQAAPVAPGLATAAGAPAVPGAPAAPVAYGAPVPPGGKPPKSGGLPVWAWWVIGGGALLVLAVIIFGAIFAFRSVGGGNSAGAVAEEYVTALNSGDYETANQLARASEEDKREALLFSDAYSEAETPTDYKVTKMSSLSSGAYATVTFTLDGSKLEGYLEILKDEEGWYVAEGITTAMPSLYSSGVDSYRVPGYDGEIANDSQLETYPAVFTVESPNKYYTVADDTKIVVDGSTYIYEVEFTPSDEYLATVNAEMKSFIDACYKEKKASDSDLLWSCGAYGYSSEVYKPSSFSVKVNSYPKAGVSDYGTVEIAEPGSVTISLEGEGYDGGSAKEDVKSEFSSLYVTTQVDDSGELVVKIQD